MKAKVLAGDVDERTVFDLLDLLAELEQPGAPGALVHAGERVLRARDRDDAVAHHTGLTAAQRHRHGARLGGVRQLPLDTLIAEGEHRALLAAVGDRRFNARAVQEGTVAAPEITHEPSVVLPAERSVFARDQGIV